MSPKYKCRFVTEHGCCLTIPSYATHVETPIQKRGLTIMGLYIFQVTLGMAIHYFHIKIPFPGHRSPQNFIHALLGLAIIALATYQVRFRLSYILYECSSFVRVG